jgi:hypothetical protein
MYIYIEGILTSSKYSNCAYLKIQHNIAHLNRSSLTFQTSKSTTHSLTHFPLIMPVDHFSLSVPQSQLESVITFLVSSLQHLGFKEHMRPIPSVVGLGEATPYLWITGLDPVDGDEKTYETLLKKTHIAFTAQRQSA